MNTAQELINAVQSCKPGLLRLVIDRLQRQARIDFSKVSLEARHRYKGNPINARLPQFMNLTALHVASKAYSAHANNGHLARVFDEMVRDLLEAGANPWAEANKAPGMDIDGLGGGYTVAQVCEGRVPPALAQFFGDHCDCNKTNTNDARMTRLHPSTEARNQARIEAWRARNPQSEVMDPSELDRLEELEEEALEAAVA